jgi:hypothetical protein
MAIRTGETVAILTTCLAATHPLCPDLDLPSPLRKTVDRIAKSLRSQAAQARGEGVGADILDSGREERT